MLGSGLRFRASSSSLKGLGLYKVLGHMFSSGQV